MTRSGQPYTSATMGTMLDYAVETFHSDRYLMLRNLPENVNANVSAASHDFQHMSAAFTHSVCFSIHPPEHQESVQWAFGNGEGARYKSEPPDRFVSNHG